MNIELEDNVEHLVDWLQDNLKPGMSETGLCLVFNHLRAAEQRGLMSGVRLIDGIRDRTPMTESRYSVVSILADALRELHRRNANIAPVT